MKVVVFIESKPHRVLSCWFAALKWMTSEGTLPKNVSEEEVVFKGMHNYRASHCERYIKNKKEQFICEALKPSAKLERLQKLRFKILEKINHE